MFDSGHAILRLSGEGVRDFLQDLVTNDVRRLEDGPVYAALLNPQGKYLFDFFLWAEGADVLVDVASDRAEALAQRLTMYRLRRKITIGREAGAVAVGEGEMPRGAAPDPRDPLLGWRMPLAEPGLPQDDDCARRVRLCVPKTGIELIPDEGYILEMGFERLHGVDFRKGCYVGQEVTARMHHKTELRKGLVRVEIEGEVPIGTPVSSEGKAVGAVFSQADGRGLAHLRFDLASGVLEAAGVRLKLAT